MTAELLKETLLSLNIFNDNRYLDDYINLIVNNLSTEKEKGITEQHHIIPRVYYKYKKIDQDDTETNLVHLKYCDHVLAHCLLALSFSDKYMISASIDGIYAVLNSFNIYSTLEEFVDDYPNVKDVLKCNHFVSDEQLEKLRIISSNSKWYNNGEKETFTTTGCPEGWVPGRLKNTDSWKATAAKLSKHSSNCHWYNNGIESTFTIKCPDGWVPGRIMTDKLLASQKRNSQISAKQRYKPENHIKKTNKKWYTNGITEATFEEGTQPNGWYNGRSEESKYKIVHNKIV